MFLKFIGGSFVALWLVLLGIDFSGDAGLIRQYCGSETDRAVDLALADYGHVTNISNDAALTVRHILAPHPEAFVSPSLIHSVSTECANSEKPFPREDIPLYKFYLVLLI